MDPHAEAVRATALTRRFGARTAVDNVDLVVARGSVHGLVGPNGAGKTTLMRMMLSLARPTSGSVTVLGQRIVHNGTENAVLRRVGALVEEPRFHTFMSGRDNLLCAAEVRGGIAAGRVDEVLTLVGLRDRAGDRVKGYSLGMRQRLGIARCLLTDPDVLLLDEPLNGLDPAGIKAVRNLLREQAERGRAVLISSHLLGEVERVIDSLTIMSRGRVVETGSVQGFREAAHAQTGGAVLIQTSDPDEALEYLRARLAAAGLAGVSAVRHEGKGGPDAHIHVALAAGVEMDRAAAMVNRELVENGTPVHGIRVVEPSLEDIYFEQTATGPSMGGVQ